MNSKAAVFGEALFDLIEQPSGAILPFIGGSPFNVARSFAKQNVAVSYLSPISTDEYGKRIHDYAIQENIKLPVNNRSDLPTSLALVYKDESGQPDYRLYRKGIADLDASFDKLLSFISDDIALVHTGSLALVPSMVPILMPFFKEIKSKGIVLSLDINMRKGVELDEAEYVKAVYTLLPYADIVKVSDEDLLLLGINASPMEGATQVLEKLTDGMVLLTKGEHGATLLTDELSISKPVFTPNKFVDAVGAGDTFFSAFLSFLLKKEQINKGREEAVLSQALAFGLMAATLNVERNGCQPPSEDEVYAALDARE